MALTLLAAVLTGFGLGTLALGLAHPVPEVAELPPPEATAQGQVATLETDGTSPPWPEAFGAPPPDAPPLPEPEDEPEPTEEAPPPDPEPDYILRGVVTDPEGGWVLLEGSQGIELARMGEQLSGGEWVTEITRDAVILEYAGEDFLIEFEARASTTQAERDARTQRHLDEARDDRAVWEESDPDSWHDDDYYDDYDYDYYDDEFDDYYDEEYGD